MFSKLIEKTLKCAKYCIHGVWEDTRASWKVKLVKIANLSVRSFMDRDLQMKSCALTYKTVLAIVPGLAMIFAIARGFGFQNILQSQLFKFFPSQQKSLQVALTYVDNYLSQTSQGLFVGIGLVVLLWTLVSLMSDVEDTFNSVWNVRTNRSLVRKFTDYTAIMLLFPILLLCSAGISIFMSDAVQRVFDEQMFTPVVQRLINCVPYVISCLVFVFAYYIIPNARVNFKSALWAGIICGTLFHVTQWLFVTGQIYVSKYNAIYGSFAFLPLLLVWIQLSWLIALAGVVLTYSSQHIFNYTHSAKSANISQDYFNNLSLAVLAEMAKRFKNEQPAITASELNRTMDLPGELVSSILAKLTRAKLITEITAKDENAFQPAFDINSLTINRASNAIAFEGESDFIPIADDKYAPVIKQIKELRKSQQSAVEDILLIDLPDIVVNDN